MEKRKVWIVSHYSMPPQYETRVKTLKYAQYLSKKGYDVLLFTASTIHNTNINLMDGSKLYEKKTYDDLNFVHIYCHAYNGNGIKRIMNMQEFSHKFSKVAKNFKTPDIIVAADMNCTNYKPIFKFCHKKNIPMIIDIRDFWPESIVEYLHFSKNNPIIKYLYHEEKEMYKNVDCSIISVEGGIDYIKEKHWDKDIDLNKIQYINNGVDLKEFKDNTNKYTIDDVLLNSDSFKVIYTGSIRLANDIGSIVNAAENLKDKNIFFLIYGDGPEKEKFENIVKEKKLNVFFQGQVKREYIPYVLSKADLTILNYAPSNMFRFGGSQNKFFEYAAAGKPIISNIKMGYDPILKYDLGKVVEVGNSKSLSDAIEYFYNTENEKKKCADNCQEFIKLFDYEILCEKLKKIIDILIEGERII
ncbi:MAG: glycosyltransferase family 4 protein [Bacilli bacterium]